MSNVWNVREWDHFPKLYLRCAVVFLTTYNRPRQSLPRVEYQLHNEQGVFLIGERKSFMLSHRHDFACALSRVESSLSEPPEPEVHGIPY